MGEICALHNMNNYMHFFGIVFLYIIFIIVVIYFIYTLYCKHKNIVEKYDTSAPPDNPRSYYDEKSTDPTYKNFINKYIDSQPKHDIFNNENFSKSIEKARDCKIRFQEKECTPEDGSNCEYTFKGGWKENSDMAEKYITADNNHITRDDENSFFNHGCHKKFNPNGKNFEYNVFNTNFTEDVLKILPFDTSANDTNNKDASTTSLADGGKSNYISMYFDTRGENNLSKILNNICSYDEQIPNALPENLYKFNLTKEGDNYRISSITKIRIDPNTGIINILENGGVINNNLLTESINAIKLESEGNLIKVQKRAKISEIDNIILYKFNFNTLCHNNKITNVVKSQPVKLYANNLYSYGNNQTQTWFPVANNKYLSLNGNIINLNDIFSDENDKAYFKNNLNAMIDNVDYHLTNKINTIKDKYNTNPIKINARKSIEAKMNKLRIKINELEELKDNYIRNINNLNYIDKYDSNYIQYLQYINKHAREIEEIKNSTDSIVEGFGLGNISTNAVNYLISNCEIGDNKENPRNKIYTVFDDNNRDTEPDIDPSLPKNIIYNIPTSGYRYHILTYEYNDKYKNSTINNNQRIYTIDFPENAIADILVVGGGGAGGHNSGGGGGAGGLVYGSGITLNGTYTIKVGNGGVYNSSNNNTDNGIDSEIIKGNQTITAKGGGSGVDSSFHGQSGGSGGGSASDYWDTGDRQGGSSTQQTSFTFEGKTLIGYGNSGGLGRVEENGGWGRAGGGGGGAGAPGNTSANYTSDTGQARRIDYGGDGGIGRQYDISGVNTYYAGGGGGGIHNNQYAGYPGKGGLGGGGNAGQPFNNGSAGVNGTGGGGGAAGGGGGSHNITFGGNGGSGIVIIRYIYISEIKITHKYLEFTYKGTTENDTTYKANFPVNTKCDILVVAGGGGGGKTDAGGGGAGGVIYEKGLTLNGTYTIKVGRGGLGGKNPTSDFYVGLPGEKGKNSQIKGGNIVINKEAIGGGGGGSGHPNDVEPNQGNSGSSGGLGTSDTIRDSNNYHTEGQGYPGGIGHSSNGGGGGGGAGGQGLDGSPSTPANGGIGRQIDITGSLIYYAGGGGGGHGYGYTSGGLGGGGSAYSSGNGSNATYYGGGGGGGGGNWGNGGNGYSGIVIIRYEIPRSRTIDDVITCDINNNYVYQSKGTEFSNIGEKFNCIPSSSLSTPSKAKGFTYDLNDREIEARHIKGEVITGSYQCPPNTKLKISLKILLNDGDLSMDRISYIYEIKLHNNNIGKLIENNKCTSSGSSYTFTNTTSDFKILNLYANIVINNNHSSKINYSYIFNVSVDNNTSSSSTNNNITSSSTNNNITSSSTNNNITPSSTNNNITPSSTNNQFVETFLTNEPNEWVSKTYIKNGYDIVLKEDIDVFLKGLAMTPINAATKYIIDYNKQLMNDDQFLMIDRDCNKFNIKPNECNYIEKINLNKRDFNMAFSTNNINSLFSISEIPSPQFIPNVPITNVFNISNIKNYITEEQQLEPSMRVPKFTPGGYSLYFQINSN